MHILIVNPIAGNGRAKKVFSDIQKDPLYKEKECRSFVTKYEGHAKQLAIQVNQLYKDKIECLIVIGGDGTIHEVMNGLIDFPTCQIAYIPAGSGNDFARGCNIPTDHLKVFHDIIRKPRSIPYWLGNYRTDHRKGHQSQRFVNSIGFGFDAVVAKRANGSFYKSIFNYLKIGTLSYSIALIQSLIGFKPQTVELFIDENKRIINNVWMVTMTNHPYFGGGMKIVPDAKINGDHFYVFIVHNISKLKILALFITVFFGKHTQLKEVTIIPARHVHLATQSSIDYQVDGNTGRCQQCVIEKNPSPRQVYGFLKSRKKGVFKRDI